jgi:hypothetical protein
MQFNTGRTHQKFSCAAGFVEAAFAASREEEPLNSGAVLQCHTVH